MVVIKIVYKTTLTNSYYEKTLAIGEVKCIDDEIPFDIPRGWQWCRFGSLSFNRDSERIPLSASERNGLDKLYDYYGASGVIDKVDKYLFDKPLLLIGEDGANLINRSTPIAFIATGRYWVNNHAHVIDFISDSLMKYMCNYINAISLIDYVTGTAQPKMNQEKMNSILVAVPPMHEQIRINEQLTKILPIIAKYSRQQNVLDNFNRIISENIRKSILQEAIQGRLVPQIESEGTAEELLEEIRAEKLRLVKEGKLKKSALANESRIFRGEDNRYYEQIGNSTVDITEELPFEIPVSWSWSRLGNIANLHIGKTPPRGEPIFWSNGKWPWVSISDIEDGATLTETKEMVSDEAAKQVFKSNLSPKGSLIMSFKLTIGKVAILGVDAFHNEAIITVQPYNNSDSLLQYLKRVLPTFAQMGDSKDAIKGKTLNSTSLANLFIPLPPIMEQVRIETRLSELFQKMK